MICKTYKQTKKLIKILNKKKMFNLNYEKTNLLNQLKVYLKKHPSDAPKFLSSISDSLKEYKNSV